MEWVQISIIKTTIQISEPERQGKVPFKIKNIHHNHAPRKLHAGSLTTYAETFFIPFFVAATSYFAMDLIFCSFTHFKSI